jgi:hypothetical protein
MKECRSCCIAPTRMGTGTGRALRDRRSHDDELRLGPSILAARLSPTEQGLSLGRAQSRKPDRRHRALTHLCRDVAPMRDERRLVGPVVVRTRDARAGMARDAALGDDHASLRQRDGARLAQQRRGFALSARRWETGPSGFRMRACSEPSRKPEQQCAQTSAVRFTLFQGFSPRP